MKLESFLGEIPKYAILSHTWEQEEVSFQEMTSGPREVVKAKKGYSKIEMTCTLAARNQYQYVWVDTCCI